MSYNDCSSVAFVEARKYTWRVETFAKRNFPEEKFAKFKGCKKRKKFRKRKIFHVYCMKKLTKDKKRKEMAKLMKVSAIRRAADL